MYCLQSCYFCNSKLKTYDLAGIEIFGCRNLSCTSRYRVKWYDNYQNHIVNFSYQNNYFSVYLERKEVHVNSALPGERFYTCFNRLVTPEKAVQMRSLYG